MATKKEKAKTSREKFVDKIAELKKEKSKEELLEIVQTQPFNDEISYLMAARKALDELGVKYPLTFKIQCEQRSIPIPAVEVEEETEEEIEDSKPVKKPTKTSKKKQN